jgi:ELWxxDGT repeat protein
MAMGQPLLFVTNRVSSSLSSFTFTAKTYFKHMNRRSCVRSVVICMAVFTVGRCNAATVRLVADLNSGPGWSLPRELTEYHDRLYFVATDSRGTPRLWEFDGRTFGKVPIPKKTDFDIGRIAVFQDKLVFNYDGDGHGSQLWSYDGRTVARLIPDAQFQVSGTTLVEFNNALYFFARDEEHRHGLWKFDGERAQLALDYYSPGPFDSGPNRLTVWRGALHFTARKSSEAGVRLWRFDGVNTEAAPNFEVSTSALDPMYLYYDREFTQLGSDLYFVGGLGVDTVLWKYDGTSVQAIPGVTRVQEDLLVHDGQLYFFARDPTPADPTQPIRNLADIGRRRNLDLWKFDGTDLVRLTDRRFSTIGTQFVGELYPFLDRLFFSAFEQDQELWSYDGQTAGRFWNINQQFEESYASSGVLVNGSSDPSDFFEFQGKLYFSADDGLHGRELWVFDPTSVPEASMLLLAITAAPLIAGMRPRRSSISTKLER